MSDTKFTRAPWTIRRTSTMRDFCIEIDGDHWSALAEVVVKFNERPSAEGEANARLISAAPDLYEALTEAAWYIEQLERLAYAADDTGEHEVVVKLKAALAQVVGDAL